MTDIIENKKIVIFDGFCKLCNSSVNFIIERDKEDNFRFASLQSEFGNRISEIFNLASKNYDSILLIDNEKLYLKSSAILRILKYLPGLWKFLYVFKIIPKNLRDYLYDVIALNRYKWFGTKSYCLVPTPEIKKKFID